MKNTNAKGFDKDCKQSSSSQFKNQDKGKKDVRETKERKMLGMTISTLFPQDQNALDVKASDI